MKQNKLFKCWLLAVILLAGSGVTWGQGNETFTGITTNTSSYGAASWTGDNGLSCSATDARTDQTITGKAITLRQTAGSLTIPLTTAQQTAGVGVISFKAANKAAAGDNTKATTYQIVCGSVTKTVTQAAMGTNTVTVTSPEINSTDAQSIVITITGLSGVRVTIDDLTWSAATSSCTTPTYSFASSSVSKLTTDAPFTNAFTSNNTSTKVWSSSNTAVANVNSSTGEVSIVGAGTASIKVNQAADATYCAVVDASYTLTVTAPPPPSAPVATAATSVSASGFTANWGAVSGATGYKLDVYTKSGGGNATDLFISEYIEGSSNNKYIEIYNGTGSSVDLSNYKLQLFANGATIATNDVQLSGILLNGATIVYKNGSAALTLPNGVTATANTAIAFNGDDAIALFKISTSSYVDIFGRIGERPSTSWGAGDLVTVDKTLVRKSTVKGGVTTNPSSGFPTLATEWDSYNIDVVSNLGSHTFAGGGSNSYVSGYQDLTVSGTNQAISGLSAGTTYYYVVRAVNANGTSGNSNEITAVTASGATPTITVTETTIPAMSAVANSTTHSETINIGGTNLTGNITVTIDGTNAAMFSVVTNPSPLTSAGGTATITYTPTAAGTHTATLRLNSTGATEVTRELNGTATSPAVTYTWQGADNGDWTTGTNWNPERTTPAANDILQFNDGTTKTVTNVPAQTIAQLSVSNSTKITLQAGAANTLSIAGGTGDDLSVAAGSELNISGATNELTIGIGTGATGNVSGAITFTDAAHRLTSADAGSLTFNNGSVFAAGTGFSGNAFGTTSLGSVIFGSGSVYIAAADSNPFGATQPNSVVVFQTGSLYKLTGNISPAFSGRTYANFEIDATGASITPTGASAVTIDNLTITNGTLNFNMTGTPGHKINGNVSVASGAHLNFAPTTDGTVAITGNITVEAGGKLSTGTKSTVSVAGNLTIESSATGTGTLVDNGTLAVSGTPSVQQYLASQRNWYMSSPVAAAARPGSDYSDVEIYNEANNTWAEMTGTMEVGKGYVVYPATTGEKTITFTGTLNTGDKTVTNLTRTAANTTYQGFNLVGNPYPSYLNIDNLKDNTDIVKSVWFRAQNSSNEYVFDTYNIPSGLSIGLSGKAVTKFIPPMQAFWLRVAAGKETAAVNFLNANRGHIDNTNNVFRAPQAVANQILRLQLSNGTATDETVLYFNANAADGYDAYDSPKMLNNGTTVPNLYTTVGTEKLVINGMNAIPYNVVLPLSLQGAAGTYTITASEFSNFAEGDKVQLIDNGITTDLTLGNYTFSIAAGENTAGRFSVVFPKSGVPTGVDNAGAGDVTVFTRSNRIVVTANEAAQGSMIYVFNGVGQRLAAQAVSGTVNEIGRTFPAGVYVVKVNNVTAKVVVK